MHQPTTMKHAGCGGKLKRCHSLGDYKCADCGDHVYVGINPRAQGAQEISFEGGHGSHNKIRQWDES